MTLRTLHDLTGYERLLLPGAVPLGFARTTRSFLVGGGRRGWVYGPGLRAWGPAAGSPIDARTGRAFGRPLKRRKTAVGWLLFWGRAEK